MDRDRPFRQGLRAAARAGVALARFADDRRRCVRMVWPVALALGALVACTWTAPPLTVRIGTIGSIDELPLLVIQEQGLDRKHGLRFELSTFTGGAALIDAMAAGSVDAAWAIGTVPLLTAAERGTVSDQVIAIATNAVADPTHPGIAVVAEPTVTGWEDLEGRVIGVYGVNSLGGAALRVRLEREGVHDYRLAEIAMANLGLALASGTVAAAAMPEPFVTQSILRGDGKLLGWVIGGPPLERMVFTVLAVPTPFYRHHPDRVKALLRAHLTAVQWINANPEAARRLMAQRLGIRDELARRIHLLEWPPDARPDAALFRDMQHVLVARRVLRSVTPAELVFDTEALEDVLRERRR